MHLPDGGPIAKKIAHVKRKNVNVMESVMNAENIILSQNAKDLVKRAMQPVVYI